MTPVLDNVLTEGIAAAVGALVGALAAVFIASLGTRGRLRRIETAALNELVLDLSFRRALVVVDPHRLDDDVFAAHADDRQRAVTSVLDIRTEIKETRPRLRVRSVAFEPLARMTAACNRFLESESQDPQSYWIGLHKLQAELHDQTLVIRAGNEDVLDLSPGTSAF